MHFRDHIEIAKRTERTREDPAQIFPWLSDRDKGAKMRAGFLEASAACVVLCNDRLREMAGLPCSSIKTSNHHGEDEHNRMI